MSNREWECDVTPRWVLGNCFVYPPYLQDSAAFPLLSLGQYLIFLSWLWKMSPLYVIHAASRIAIVTQIIVLRENWIMQYVFSPFCSKGKIFAWQGQLPLDLPPLCAPASGSCHSTCHRQMHLPPDMPRLCAPATLPATTKCACHGTCHGYVRLPPPNAPTTGPATAMCACHSTAGMKLCCGWRDASVLRAPLWI